MKKTLLVLALIVFSIPVITFAKDVPPGQPFQQLQDQINTINSRLDTLATQVLNFGNNTAQQDIAIDRITASIEGLKSQVLYLGVNQIIHGRISGYGEILAGDRWSLIEQYDVDLAYHLYRISLNTFSQPPAEPPQCVVLLASQPGVGACKTVPVAYASTQYSSISMEKESWILEVHVGALAWEGYTAHCTYPAEVQFDFICVQ